MPGNAGMGGMPGGDAQYCPCPARSARVGRKSSAGVSHRRKMVSGITGARNRIIRGPQNTPRRVINRKRSRY
ncbi:hypothetical protein Aduo_003576 [Ancylostoma duodenale]